MSEYQHYEFHAVDRPLNSKEMNAVRAMSSRVKLSPRKAIFTYSYSDFRYREEDVLLKYFDFMFYISSWGTKRIMMKFPIELVDYDFLKKYRISVIDEYEQDIQVLKKGKYMILDISYSEEDGLGWIEEDNYGYDFLNIRSEIMNGDYRSLFVIWLRFLEDLYKSNEFDLDYTFDSKLVPSNLQKLTPSGEAVKEFYQVNEDWFKVIQFYSGEADEDNIDYMARLLEMPKERMIEYMKMILESEPNLKIRLIKELMVEHTNVKEESSHIKLVEVGEKVANIEQVRLEAEQKKKAREEVEQMNKIRQNKDHIEQGVIVNIEQGNHKNYKLALSKILELKAMHHYFNTETELEAFLNRVRSEYSRKSSFIRMLKEENLIEK